MRPSVAAPGVLWVAKPALTTMLREADRIAPLETGGVLMGYWVRTPRDGDGGEVVVTAAIGPGPGAVHERFAFTPDHEYQEREIGRSYNASGRQWTYLGDWHTHPEGPARLSDRDRATLRRIASDGHARAPVPIMMLLAGGQPWIPRAWCARAGASRWWRRGALTLTSLTTRTYEEQR